MSQAWNRPSTHPSILGRGRWRRPIATPATAIPAANDDAADRPVGLAEGLAIVALGAGLGVIAWAVGVGAINLAFPL